MFFAPTNLAKLKVARDTAHDSYLKAIDDSFKLLKTSADEGVDLNAQTLGSITKAYDGFNTLAKITLGLLMKFWAVFKSLLPLETAKLCVMAVV
jgi:hypothetical protein